MDKVYLILDDEPLSRRNIILVDSEEKAKFITGNNKYMSYEEVGILSDSDVKDMVCDERLSTMDNTMEFFEAHCIDCNVKYNEECPYF